MHVRALWAGIGAGALWGFSVLAPKLTWNFDPWDVAFSRYLVYGLVSAAHLWLLSKDRTKDSKEWFNAKTIWTSFVFSLVANTIYYTLLVYCARRSGVPLTSLMVGLIPVTVAWFGRSKEIPIRKMVGPLAALALGLFILQWQDIRKIGKWDWIGFALLVFEVVIWTWYAIRNAQFLQAHKKITGSVWSSLSGVTTLTSMGLVWVIQKLVFEPPTPVPNGLPAASPEFFVFVAILSGFGASWLAFGWWNYASQKLTTALSGQLMIFETLFALLYTWILEVRLPTPYETVATVLFVLGVNASIRILGQAKIAV